MKDELVSKLDKYLTFIFVTIKISVRDLYIFPLGQIDKLLKLSGVILIITTAGRIFNIFCFLDYKGAITSFLIILILKILTKKIK